jgi:hypothetical protein
MKIIFKNRNLISKNKKIFKLEIYLVFPLKAKKNLKNENCFSKNEKKKKI